MEGSGTGRRRCALGSEQRSRLVWTKTALLCWSAESRRWVRRSTSSRTLVRRQDHRRRGSADPGRHNERKCPSPVFISGSARTGTAFLPEFCNWRAITYFKTCPECACRSAGLHCRWATYSRCTNPSGSRMRIRGSERQVDGTMGSGIRRVSRDSGRRRSQNGASSACVAGPRQNGPAHWQPAFFFAEPGPVQEVPDRIVRNRNAVLPQSRLDLVQRQGLSLEKSMQPKPETL